MKKVKKHRGVIILAAIVLIVGIGVTLFFKGIPGGNTEATSVKKQSTLRLSKMDLTKSISATGTIASAKSKSVSASVNAIQVRKALVQVGDEVKKGDELIVFDRSSLKEELKEAKDSLADARDEADRSVAAAKKQLASATETYSDSKARLQKEVSKARKARDKAKNTVSSLTKKLKAAKDMAEKQSLNEQLTKAKEAYSQAKEAYSQAVTNQTSTNKQNSSSVENARDSLESARANREKSIKNAKKQVEKAQENYDSCEVTAPIKGTVTSISVEAGDVYSGGTICTIEDMDSFEVSTSVDEYDISNVEKGQKVILLTEATDEDELEGKITFVAPSVTSQTASSNGDMGSDSSGGYTVKIAVKTKDGRLKPGMTAKCSIILEEAEDVYAVPYDAIQTREDGTKYINVVDMDSSGDNRHSMGNGEDQENAEKAFEDKEGNDSQSAGNENAAAETKEIEVTTGLESDYYVEITGQDLSEGLMVEIPTDEVEASTDSDSSGENNLLGGMGGGMPDGGGDMPGGKGGNNRGGGGGPNGAGGGR